MYVQIDADKWIKTDGSKAEILSLVSLQSDLSAINQRLSEIPAEMTDNELLAWAKLNHPGMDYSKERDYLGSKKSVIETDLSNMGA